MYENRKGETGMMKRISVLGSTGSIGTQALDVIKNNSDRFRGGCSVLRKTYRYAAGTDQYCSDLMQWPLQKKLMRQPSLRNSAAWKQISGA